MAAEPTRRSAFIEGCAIVLREPALWAAELTWRWCFGISAWLVLVGSNAMYLHSLTVAPADELLLNTLRPSLMLRAMEHVFQGSLLRFVWIQAVVLIGLVLLWSFAATLGRAVILQRLCAFAAPAERVTLGLGPLFHLNLLRAIWSVAAIGTLIASLVLGSRFAHQQQPFRAALFLVFGTALSLLFGGLLNWLLGTAPMFCVLQGVSAPEALARTVDWFDEQGTSLSGLSLGFFVLRGIWAAAMVFFFWSPLSLAKQLAVGWIMLLMGVVALVYFAGNDVLGLARLAAYLVLATEGDSGPAVAQELPLTPAPEPGVGPEFEPA